MVFWYHCVKEENGNRTVTVQTESESGGHFTRLNCHLPLLFFTLFMLYVNKCKTHILIIAYELSGLWFIRIVLNELVDLFTLIFLQVKLVQDFELKPNSCRADDILIGLEILCVQ